MRSFKEGKKDEIADCNSAHIYDSRPLVYLWAGGVGVQMLVAFDGNDDGCPQAAHGYLWSVFNCATTKGITRGGY